MLSYSPAPAPIIVSILSCLLAHAGCRPDGVSKHPDEDRQKGLSITHESPSAEATSIQQIAQQLFIEVNEEEDSFRSALPTLFQQTATQSYLLYRVQPVDWFIDVLATNVLNEQEADPAYRLTGRKARELLDEGVAACFVFHRPTPGSLETFHRELLSAIESRNLRVLEIGNYNADAGPSLTQLHIDQIESANEKAHGIQIRVGVPHESGASATGRTGLQLSVEYRDGTEAEIQLRGELMQQLLEATQLFYEQRDGGSPGLACSEGPISEELDTLFAAVVADEVLAVAYEAYISEMAGFVNSWLKGNRAIRPPLLPSVLGSYEQLAVENIAAAMEATLLLGILDDPEGFSIQERHLTYDSSQFVSVTQPIDVRRSIGGLVNGGTGLRRRFDDAVDGLQGLAREAEGFFNVAAALLWEEDEYLESRRSSIRASRRSAMEGKPRQHPWAEGVIDLPEYDEDDGDNLRSLQIDQSPVNLGIHELHFMQDSCGFFSGERDEYNVLSTARAIQQDPEFMHRLPPLEVWKDKSERVWSLDHRRLVAYTISGVITEVPVVFVDRETATGVEENGYKFTNPVGGTAIVLEADEHDPRALVIMKVSEGVLPPQFDYLEFDADLKRYRDHLLRTYNFP